MNNFNLHAADDVAEVVQNFLDRHQLEAGKLKAHTLLGVDVYVAWNTASRYALYSRVIPFGDAEKAQEAVRILTAKPEQAAPALAMRLA